MFPNRHRHTNFENKLTVIEREMDAARGNELGAWDEHTHPPPTIYRTDNQQGLLYSTGNPTQYPVTTNAGNESEKHESLHVCSWITMLHA